MFKALRNWIWAIRPKTLAASFAPVLIATGMAYGDGVHNYSMALICLATALALQIGTNLANDYFDSVKGVDTAQRIGPTRVTQAGLISAKQVRWAFVIAFFVAAGLGVFLIQTGGWPIAILMVVSILSGYFYTAGPVPLAYVGLGDFFVLVFFGPVAVMGCYYLQSFEMNLAVFLAGLAPGLIAMAILVVNNYRDIDSDREAGRKTLAVRFGAAFCHYQYMLSLMIAVLIPLWIYVWIRDHIAILMCSLLAILVIPLALDLIKGHNDGPKLNRLLARTGQFLMIYSLMFAIGWML